MRARHHHLQRHVAVGTAARRALCSTLRIRTRSRVVTAHAHTCVSSDAIGNAANTYAQRDHTRDLEYRRTACSSLAASSTSGVAWSNSNPSGCYIADNHQHHITNRPPHTPARERAAAIA
jgi:hypothetical protein